MSTDPKDDLVEFEVKKLLELIDGEKKQPKPDKKKMKQWFNKIVQLREDWRVTWTGQNNRFQSHTSDRSWHSEFHDDL